MNSVSLLDQTFPRTLDDWVQRFSHPDWRGARVEGWLFEGADARRAAEQQLAAAGVDARLRSAYKPLVHHFLEEIDTAKLASAIIRYPVHAQALPRRFLLEAYPLATMLPGCALEFLPGHDDLHYAMVLTYRDGSQHQVLAWAPNRVHVDLQGVTLLSPTGWLRVSPPAGAQAPQIDHACQTDYEQVFERILGTVDAYSWPAQEPYFERLDIRVDMPGIEQPLPLEHECISTFEALHEDIYFSLLEIFQRRSGRPAQDRRLQPGQIVPDVRMSAAPGQAAQARGAAGGEGEGTPVHHDAPRLRITHNSFDIATQDQSANALGATDGPLEELGSAPTPTRIAAEMARLGGQRFKAASRQGRNVAGLYRAGAEAAVLITGGQHANETSGVVGALRAARALYASIDANFALIALENPDGYALHRELRMQHAHHMHHAARYSALGDDIEYREPGSRLYEREARNHALAVSGAQLHINLHGYPAHEWTRPLSGYVPRGFELWTVPKGFFLILRHHPGWEAEARALLESVSDALAKVPGLVDYNARQIALYERHAGALPFDVLHGMAYTLSEVARPGAPVTLITEFPDETVTGDAFRFAHTVQMEAALAATQAWQTLARRP